MPRVDLGEESHIVIAIVNTRVPFRLKLGAYLCVAIWLAIRLYYDIA